MTHVATMGTSSCATIAVGGFKDAMGGVPLLGKDANEAYKNDPQTFKNNSEGLTVKEFYDDILYPTRQDLGRTKEYPFEQLMEEIANSSLKTKYVVITLNNDQQMNGYWPKEIERWGFELVDKTNNSIGSMNWIYTRNPNRPTGYVKKDSGFA